METRKLGYTDLELTTIGLGTWALGGGDYQFGWGPQDDVASIATIHRALDAGINWIDTAAVYGLGRSEEVIGKALKGRRDGVIIATKCGRDWSDPENIGRNAKPERIRQEVEDSLRRLQTDVIDLYQIHWPDPDVPLEESWQTMADLITEGKVRAIGVSNFSVAQMQTCQSVHPVASLQPPYNLINRGIEDAILPFCGQNNIGVIVYSPMASGLLTGAFDFNRLAPNDWRRGPERERFVEPNLSRNLAFVERLRPIADGYGKTVAHLAVAWTLARKEVTAAIVGARTIAQVDKIMAGAEFRLNDADLGAIEDAHNEVFGG